VPGSAAARRVEAVCTDMHQPYLNAVGEVLKKAEIVFDKFHVLQHASAALDEVSRRVLSGRCGDARLWPRQALVARAPLEDGARLEAERVAAVCRQSSVVQGVHPARAARSVVLNDSKRTG
jgi:hypothetical protein